MNGQNRLLSTEPARVINIITQSIQEKYTYLIWVVPALLYFQLLLTFYGEKNKSHLRLCGEMNLFLKKNIQ